MTNITFFAALFSQLLQLSLIWYLVYSFHIEADLWLERFLFLVMGFFFIHSVSPIRFRPIVFFFSFVFTLFLFLRFGDAGTLLLMGFGILGLCHLPISMTIRRLLVLSVGIYLALARIGIVWSPLSNHGLTVFAAIFMFRTIVYLYELKYEKESASIWHRLNYFFMLPNIVFPLFPIVDYKTYLSTYYNQSDTFIYQRGINLILWSVICFLIYRWLYYFAVPDLTTIDGVEKVSQYIIATYLTVIRLIGILSLSVGVLRLFGYNLPDIFNYMFFASSFSDLFRRINIYWKSFLMKLCYYPVYFKLRKTTPKHALLLSALITFFFTWFFHIYQWAWILGSNPIRFTSVLYWSIFGILATTSMLLENKKYTPSKTFAGCVFHAAKVVAVFLSIAVLYSMWTNATLEEWLAIIQLAFIDDWVSWLRVGVYLLTAILLLGIGFFLYRNYLQNYSLKAGTPTWSYLSLTAMYLILFLFVRENINLDIAKFARGGELNENDANREYEGYYEDILKVDISSQLWDDQINDFLVNNNWKNIFFIRPVYQAWKDVNAKISTEMPDDAADSFSQQDFVENRNDVMLLKMLPNQKASFRGKRFSTNKWGLRDKDYEKIPPPNTIRIAILGGSPTIGYGIHDEEVFESITELRLNENFGSDSLHFEIINFSLGSGTQAFQLAYLLESEVQTFKPNYVILVDHFSRAQNLFGPLQRILTQKKKLYPELEKVLESQEFDENTIITPEKANQTGKFIKEWSLYHFSTICKKYNMKPILLYYPSLGIKDDFKKYRLTVKQAGYELFNLENVYDNYIYDDLHVSRIDKHPNAKAHQLVADRLYKELVDYLKLQ
ncbi:MAG: hypothetical protein R3E32_18255 [Chitinophagales bacterium]